MQCSKMTDLMMRYFDKELSDIELKKLEEHIDSCKSCRAEFNSLKDAISLVDSLPDLEPSLSFESKVMERIEMRRNRIITACLLIGSIGLFSFANQVFFHVILPYMHNSEIALKLTDYLGFIFDRFTSVLTSSLVYMNVTIESLKILRGIVIRDYTNVVFCFVAFIIIMNLQLFRILNLHRDLGVK